MGQEIISTLAEQIRKGVQILKAGGTVAYPTDTVYGLGADAFNKEAVEKIYEIKGRPRQSAFPLLLADINQVAEVASSVPEIAWLLMRHFWPGGLTLVLPKRINLPDYLTYGGATIAVRIPNHPVPLTLIKRMGSPLIGTSANISGQPSALTAKEVEIQLGGRVSLIIDGGRCSGGVESTIIDVTGKMPKIRRQGLIPKEEIEKLLGINLGE